MRTGLSTAAIVAFAFASGAAYASVGIVNDNAIAHPGAPPHEGKGQSVGYPISQTGGLDRLFFGKRRLLPGATIGRHPITHEEVYYVVSGQGDAISEEGTRRIGPGDTVVMKPGGTIEVHQTGREDLVLIVSGPRS